MARKKSSVQKDPYERIAGRRLTFKNPSQKEAYKKLKENDIIFLLGPAGTAKTHISVHYAIEEFLKQN